MMKTCYMPHLDPYSLCSYSLGGLILVCCLIDVQVVRALEGDVSLEDLNEGVRPGHSRLFGSYSSSDYDSGQYNEDMKKFRKMAFNTNNYTSSQYSAPTSEYGHIPSASSSEGHQTQEMESGAMKKSAYSGYSSGYSGAS